jgi:hypothetical protein
LTLQKGPIPAYGRGDGRTGDERKLKNQHPVSSPKPNANQHPLLAVYDGQHCRGFILGRGRSGWEAFDSSERTLGLYESQAAAANAIESEVAS